MSENMSGHDYHIAAEKAREGEEFTEALINTDKAIVKYSDEGNWAKVAEVHLSRFITLKHLYSSTNLKQYLVMAKYAVKTAIDISVEYGDGSSTALPYFHLAEIHDEYDEDYSKALEYYQESVEIMKTNPPESHSSKGVLHNIEAHMFACQYKNGDKSALEKLEKAIEDIGKNEDRKFERDVWMSGGYMRMADMLRNDDVTKAKEALGRAKEIIDSNPSLTIRSKQLKELASSFDN